MAQEGDEGYGDTHSNEDYGDFRQANPCKCADLSVSRVLQRSNGNEGNPGCLKNKFNSWILIQHFILQH